MTIAWIVALIVLVKISLVAVWLVARRDRVRRRVATSEGLKIAPSDRELRAARTLYSGGKDGTEARQG